MRIKGLFLYNATYISVCVGFKGVRVGFKGKYSYFATFTDIHHILEGVNLYFAPRTRVCGVLLYTYYIIMCEIQSSYPLSSNRH